MTAFTQLLAQRPELIALAIFLVAFGTLRSTTKPQTLRRILIGAVFFLVLLYSTSYIRHIPTGRFSSPRWFYALLFLFLFTIIGVYLTSNLGLLWIMMEATTLASALLVGFYNTEGAIEAGWKYLIVCTVGLAFALFGTIVFYIAGVRAGISPDAALQWPALLRAAPALADGRLYLRDLKNAVCVDLRKP